MLELMGLKLLCLHAEAEMHDEYNGDGCAILTEMIQSDICVEGTTDKCWASNGYG